MVNIDCEARSTTDMALFMSWLGILDMIKPTKLALLIINYQQLSLVIIIHGCSLYGSNWIYVIIVHNCNTISFGYVCYDLYELWFHQCSWEYVLFCHFIAQLQFSVNKRLKLIKSGMIHQSSVIVKTVTAVTFCISRQTNIIYSVTKSTCW